MAPRGYIWAKKKPWLDTRDTERVPGFKEQGQEQPLTRKMPTPSPTVDIGLTRKYVVFKGFFNLANLPRQGIILEFWQEFFAI